MEAGQKSRPKSARKYRWKCWALLPSLLTSAYTVTMLTVLIGIFLYGIVWLPRHVDIPFFQILTIILLGPFLILFVFFWLWFVSWPIGRLLFSYLKVSPDGIEYRYWPSYGVRCSWDSVERLGEHRSFGLFRSDVLYLERAEPVGWQINVTLRRRLGLKTQYIVPLTGISGWPRGKLAEDLRQYIPHLLEGKTAEKQPEG